MNDAIDWKTIKQGIDTELSGSTYVDTAQLSENSFNAFASMKLDQIDDT